MGGGASSMQGDMDIITATYIMGKAIAAISFPGVYRIYDFHSSKAPKLAASRKFSFYMDSDEEDDEDDTGDNIIDPSLYECYFSVKVGEDVIYIEDPMEVNDAGWTPLHSCCMSFSTAMAAVQIIEYIVQHRGDLDVKTIAGPGSFNSGWTALQMASAYGIEPIVEKLVAAGANVNAINSFGYSPILEACHKGFINIVQCLLNGNVDLKYIPSDALSTNSPFVSAPAQSALGEAARSGFHRIVQLLIDYGAPKDQCNSIGWTALHEACFYNRVETCKVLLLAGANAAARTRGGALPYHLAGLQIIRTMLSDIGGQDAVPVEGDIIDMVSILRELTSSETTLYEDEDGELQILIDTSATSSSSPGQNASSYQESSPTYVSTTTPTSKKSPPKIERGNDDSKEVHRENKESPLLHSGPRLGDLPALTPIRQLQDIPKVSRKADDKTKKKKKKNRDDVPKDIPENYLCQLSQRPMSEPVKSIYGHFYEKSTILNWLSSQGRICPLTGAPLSESDLNPDDKLGDEIRMWIFERSKGSPAKEANQAQSSKVDEKISSPTNIAIAKPTDDDLYDF